MILTFVLLAVVDVHEGDTPEVTVDLVVIGVLTLALIIIRSKRVEDGIVHRAANLLICITYFYCVSIGAGEETVLYWAFFFPPLFFFFFGQWEGGGWSLFFFFCVSLIMTMPSWFDSYIYEQIQLSRFAIAFPIVAVLCFGMESSRYIFGRLLDEKNELLLQEKERLETALNEIKTLGGLIPICSNCKKIRNDEGYWEQVDIYLRKRSSAQFSHSICPGCVKELYPDFKPRH